MQQLKPFFLFRCTLSTLYTTNGLDYQWLAHIHPCAVCRLPAHSENSQIVQCNLWVAQIPRLCGTKASLGFQHWPILCTNLDNSLTISPVGIKSSNCTYFAENFDKFGAMHSCGRHQNQPVPCEMGTCVMAGWRASCVILSQGDTTHVLCALGLLLVRLYIYFCDPIHTAWPILIATGLGQYQQLPTSDSAFTEMYSLALKAWAYFLTLLCMITQRGCRKEGSVHGIVLRKSFATCSASCS